jgi:hypothetical protein
MRAPKILECRARSGAAIVLVASWLAAFPAVADDVTDWNAVADQTNLGAPAQRFRIMAMMHIAIHDALNSIEPRYESYAAVPAAVEGASPAAAVGQAAYRVLLASVAAGSPQALFINNSYNAWVLTLDCASASCPFGMAAGDAAANAILALRVGDGSATPNLPYIPSGPPGTPGVYQLTPPNLPAPTFAGWVNLRPFVLNSASQFRAEPAEIFDLTSAAYTRDYNEVKRVGAANASAADRSPEQAQVPVYWSGGGFNFNPILRTAILPGRGLDLWEHARLFALLNMGVSDSAIAVFDTKYTYNFWRPVTAIRAGDVDGNPNTAPDATWLPLLTTPAYPDYTCGLPTNTGAAVEVLRRYFGTDEVPYTFTAGGVTRSFATLSAAADESVDARVIGGIHFRTGCTRGVIQGRQVGRFAYQHFLKPLKGNQY